MSSSSSSSLEQRLSAASTFLLQSPPGEVNDVFSDIRTIVQDDTALEQAILPALEQYNTQQLILAQLEGDNVLITGDSKLKGAAGQQRHLDPKGKRSFLFDHINLTASDPQPLAVDPETESIRSSIEQLLATHVANHYSEGACAVYALEDPNYSHQQEQEVAAPTPAPAEEQEAQAEPEPEAEVDEEQSATEKKKEEEPTTATATAFEEEPPAEDGGASPNSAAPPTNSNSNSSTPRPSRLFSLYLVGTKYNPTNYWTGKWRSVYLVDWEKGAITGEAKVAVHYYEQGNVQLSTTLSSTHSLPPTPSAPPTPTSLISLLKLSESHFSSQLSAAYSTLSDDQFRGLRRALPRTRTKVDWAKIGGYRLRGELGVAGAGGAGGGEAEE